MNCDTPGLTRYYAKIDHSNALDPDACLPWTASATKDGYGLFWFNGKMVLATRYGYATLIGPIPDGMNVCHTCDNPSCQNTRHWWLGTQTENLADRDAKNHQANGERHGSRTHPERMARGDRNGRGMAKVTESQVIEIHARYAAGGITQAEIGREYGINHSTVSRIVNRKTWQHI